MSKFVPPPASARDYEGYEEDEYDTGGLVMFGRRLFIGFLVAIIALLAG